MKVLELFAGCGGLALGLEQASFETIALIDYDQNSCLTLKTNRPHWNVINEDITKWAKQDLCMLLNLEQNELDLLSGGFPCQAFSYAGKRLGLEDTRGTLFYDYATCLKQLKPKIFLVENVKGLLTHNRGKTFQTMLDLLKKIGYQIKYQVLNAWDYGVAQKRQRLIVVGIRDDLASQIDFQFPLKHVYKPVLKDVLENVPQSTGYQYQPAKKAVLDLVPQGGCWINLPDDIAKQYMKNSYYSGGGKRGIARRLAMDQPSLTLTTSPMQKQTERCHPLETRPLTIQEYARIQSFCDQWVFVGSKASQYQQIGNAVPVLLAYEIGKAIKIVLEKILNSDGKKVIEN